VAEPAKHSRGGAPRPGPPAVMTLVGAAAAAKMPLDAAELAYRFIDSSFRSTDSRELDEHGGLPGVTREYRNTVTAGKWGEIDYINAGIEGYGWGALSIHLLIRHLLGLYATDLNSITLAPTLPLALRRPGATYTIAPIPWGKYMLSLSCQVKSTHSYEATLHLHPRAQEGQPQEHHWAGAWGEERTFLLDH